MKKLKIVSVGFIIGAGLLMGNQAKDNDVCLNNIEALACYDLESGGSSMGECCYPYTETCRVIDIWNSIPGAWYF